MTVVLKLLNLVRAGRAYFGEKDYPAAPRRSRTWRKDFFIPTEMFRARRCGKHRVLRRVRETRCLSAAARERAAVLYRALTTAADPAEARAMLEAEGFRWITSRSTGDRRFAAAFLEGVRLIDNVPCRTERHASLSGCRQ